MMNKMTPKDQKYAILWLWGTRLTISRAGYPGEPQDDLLSSPRPPSKSQNHTKQKSDNFALQYLESRMFSHFRSLWAIFLLWRYCRPLPTCRNQSQACCSGTTPFFSIKLERLSLSAWYIKINISGTRWRILCTFIVFGVSILLRISNCREINFSAIYFCVLSFFSILQARRTFFLNVLSKYSAKCTAAKCLGQFPCQSSSPYLPKYPASSFGDSSLPVWGAHSSEFHCASILLLTH